MPTPNRRPRRRLHPLGRPWLAVVVGGLVGSVGRLGVSELIGGSAGDFPWSALVVNLTGSFLLGIYLARRERAVAAESSISFWAIGVLGSFTTFSAFSVDVVNLLDAGRSLVAGGYVAVSVLGGLAIALLGDRLGSVMR
jgi:fluoride exporter